MKVFAPTEEGEGGYTGVGPCIQGHDTDVDVVVSTDAAAVVENQGFTTGVAWGYANIHEDVCIRLYTDTY
jgi:hypothetical protein